jgi:uncharacterized protein YbbC (DUF1343 family)
MTHSQIKIGLEVLLADVKRLSKQRVGLITNASGVTSNLVSTVDALCDAGVRVTTLFGPEHGFSAAAADATEVASGAMRTGLPVYSLYGKTRKPTAEMLADVDALVFDLQDVGARFYTYTTTLALVLEACAESRVPLIVLDRPNPIGGNVLEGPLLDPSLQSFIGHGRLPIRYAMTIGELARLYNGELNIGADLQVFAMEYWRREMWFDETGLAWVPPSPGIPHFSTTITYPGTCLIEGTNLSEGRGTALPFEIGGAPWIDGQALADELNRLHIDGARFRPITFTPNDSKHAQQTCYGVQVHVSDRDAFRPVKTGLQIIAACRAQDESKFEFLSTSWEGKPPHLDLLVGTSSVREDYRRICRSRRLRCWDADEPFAKTREIFDLLIKQFSRDAREKAFSLRIGEALIDPK